MTWKLQDAKQNFSQLVGKAQDEGPQVVTHCGKEIVVVLSAETYRELSDKGESFKAFLLEGTDLVDLDIERNTEPSLTVEL